MPEPVSARPVPKLRSSSTAGRPSARPRPKTIHVDQDSNVAAALAASSGGSRGNRGSSSNISGEEETFEIFSLKESSAGANRRHHLWYQIWHGLLLVYDSL